VFVYAIHVGFILYILHNAYSFFIEVIK